MNQKNVGNILQNYFKSQKNNLLEHLEQQDLNLQNHFKILENIFSSNNDDYNNIEQKLNNEKKMLENNISSQDKKFKTKLEKQKEKTNNLLSGSNIYIPNNQNQHIPQMIINNRNIRRNNNIVIKNEEKDKIMEYKKLKAISALPTFQFKYIIKYEKRNENICSICLSEFKDDELLIRFSCKEHIFHKKCLHIWLEKSDICPLCKKSLILK